MRNKIKTCGYFKKRLKDSGFIVLDVFKNFHDKDKRRWCILINPGEESILCTCYVNYDNDVSVAFEFNDDAYNAKQFGLWTHTNVRKDKFDCFPQPELVEMLKNL